MVRGGKTRIERWKEKLSGDTRKQRYDSQKQFMVRKEANATRDLVRIEEEVKILTQGEPIILIPYYIIFAKEIYSKQNKYKSRTLINEIEILETKWIRRGLSGTLLDHLKEFYVEEYKLLKHFHLDISLLDGAEVLA